MNHRRKPKVKVVRDPQQRAFLKAKSDALPEHLRPLQHLLLSYGGSFALVKPDEPDAVKIVERGVLRTWQPRGKNRSILVEGVPNQCHLNTATIFMRAYPDKGVRVETGYALSRDGIWRQHSWIRRRTQLVETTEKRVRYFGFELEDREAIKFACSNVDTEDAIRFLVEKVGFDRATIEAAMRR